MRRFELDASELLKQSGLAHLSSFVEDFFGVSLSFFFHNDSSFSNLESPVKSRRFMD